MDQISCWTGWSEQKLYETGKICVLSLKHLAIGHKLLDIYILANQKDKERDRVISQIYGCLKSNALLCRKDYYMVIDCYFTSFVM